MNSCKYFVAQRIYSDELFLLLLWLLFSMLFLSFGSQYSLYALKLWLAMPSLLLKKICFEFVIFIMSYRLETHNQFNVLAVGISMVQKYTTKVIRSEAFLQLQNYKNE